MAIPLTGTISLTDIQTEFGGTNPVSLSEYYKGGAYVLTTDYAPNVPTSGAISLSDFYGARKTTLTTVTYTTPGDNIFVAPATIVGNLIVTMTGAGGGGGGPDSQPGYSGYGGRIVTNAQTTVSAGDIINAYVGSGGGAGGSGGGGTGSTSRNTPSSVGPNGSAGTTNRGAGGGSGSQFEAGSSGGSGIVIIRYSGSQGAAGGTYTSSGGYSIHTFTGDGTFRSNTITYSVN
jgi:hypothetical protein